MSEVLSQGTVKLHSSDRSRDDLDVLHAVEHWKFTTGCSIPPELVRMHHVWDVVMHQQPSNQSLCCLRTSPSLPKQVEDCTRVKNGPPQPEVPAADLDADLVQKPPGTGSGLLGPAFGEWGRT